jgi:hypothetical protein
MAAERPLRSASTASAVASVVFPTPPFWEMIATTYTYTLHHVLT